MTRGVLLDTGPIYALLDSRDQYHARALRIFSGLAAEERPISAAFPALLEAHRLMLSRAGRNVGKAHRSFNALFDSVAVRYPTEEDGKSARTILENFDDQRISFTDATIAAMSIRLRLWTVTFDVRHFGLMGANVFDENNMSVQDSFFSRPDANE